MKTFRFMGSLLLIVATTLSFCACSSSKDEPAVEEEEDIVIPGKMPANIHVGMLYPISHDKKNFKCTFGLYLGENPSQELIDAIEKERVIVTGYDRYGEMHEVQNSYQDPVTGEQWQGFNVYIKGVGWRFRHDGTISFSLITCESLTKFNIHFTGPALFEFYPELEDLDDVVLNRVSWPGNPTVDGQLLGGDITQSWSSPHHFYK